MPTVVPFDWPLFLSKAAPSPFFAEFAAASGMQRLASEEVHTKGDDTCTVPRSTAEVDKDALLHEVTLRIMLQCIIR